MFNCIKVTIAAGTAVRFAAVPTEAQRLIITPLLGASAGVIYVLNEDVALVMSKTDQTMVTEIGPASTTAPAAPFIINRLTDGPPINVQEWGLDGAHTGDFVQVAWEQ